MFKKPAILEFNMYLYKVVPSGHDRYEVFKYSEDNHKYGFEFYGLYTQEHLDNFLKRLGTYYIWEPQNGETVS